MPAPSSPCPVFVNHRRSDAGWPARVIADALSDAGVDVFFDSRSIALGENFGRALAAGLRRSAVLVVVIGERWADDKALQRLYEDDDWVRYEILRAKTWGKPIVPVLVDGAALPHARDLPEELRFLPELQADTVRQPHRDQDLAGFVSRVVAALPPDCARRGPPSPAGVAPTRAAVDALLRRVLPEPQQAAGNRDRLVELALSVLGPRERLVTLAPARLPGRPNGSATVLVTGTALVVVDVDESFRITSGLVRLPRAAVRQVELVATRRLRLPTADLLVHPEGGDVVEIQGLFREQAQAQADLLRADGP